MIGDLPIYNTRIIIIIIMSINTEINTHSSGFGQACETSQTRLHKPNCSYNKHIIILIISYAAADCIGITILFQSISTYRYIKLFLRISFCSAIAHRSTEKVANKFTVIDIFPDQNISF